MTEKIHYLLEGYLENRLTPEELAQFLAIAEDDAHKDILQDYIHTTLAANRFSGKAAASRADMLFHATMTRAQQQQQQTTTPVRRLHPIRRSLAAAAVLLAVAGTSVILWQQNRQAPPVTARKTAAPILPGKDKATLTLEDGTVIQLDTVQNGTIASSGNVSVKKLDNGQLAYTFGKTAATPEAIGKHTLATPRGGQFRVQLPDGSFVFLNASSSIQFPAAFTSRERHVSITGEAYFEVAAVQQSNGKQPFYVHILSANGREKGKVEVLGTHFNIMAYDNEKSTVTTLLEGSVKVNTAGLAAGKTMAPGEQSLIRNETGNITVSEANTDQAVAWKNGYFSYEKSDIPTIMRQLERWYNITVEYKEIPHKTFTGTIPRNLDAAQVLNLVEQTNNVHFTIEGNKVIVGS